MVTKSERVSELIATAVSNVLHNRSLSKAAKSAAGSALSQPLTPSVITSSIVSAAASKVLRRESASKSSKTGAGTSLTQRCRAEN
jgi:hypothetical protein